MTPTPAHSPSDIIIVGAARTPFTKLLGAAASLSAPQLGAHAIQAALGDIDAELVDAVILGQVLQAGVGQNPAKQAALAAGISPRAHTTTVNKVCLSGLSAIIDAARLLRSGEADVVVAGGMESMTNAPHLLTGTRAGVKFGAVRTLDHMEHDGLVAADKGISMGVLTEEYGDAFPVTREEQDALAAGSHQRAAAADFSAEIAPLTISTRKGDVVVDADEGVRPDTTAETLARLRPAFAKEGTITAGNASPISDGAAAVVLCTRAFAESQGFDILATLRSPGQVAGPDSSLQEQPANAIKAALEREGWTVAELDHIEVNEAFAAVGVASARALGVEASQLNPHGGAIALGHPIGASGARLVVHVAHEIAAGRAGRAAVSLCGGGGQGEALLLEV